LEVYRLAHELGLRVHPLSLKLPRHELYEEGSQVRRSSKSVGSQIVEGYALRRYKSEYLHYLWRAYASAEETIEHPLNLIDTGSAGAMSEQCKTLLDEYRTLCRKLFNYITAVERRHDSSRPPTDDGSEMNDEG
jgi:four helix bundle protein